MSNLIEQKRKRKFLVELDQIIQENVDSYIDEEGQPIPCPNTEETVYNWIMEEQEYHLLASEYVKEMIHLFMTDFKTRMSILRDSKLL
jgi:hypothetical protein